VRAIVQDIVLGESPGRVSARFHNTLVEATAETVDAIADERGSFPVALSGGCFQNPRLTEGLLDRLSPRLSVHINRRVPPGDGGIALGQAVVAAATIAKGR
jgi:hydrogenase maturation protein HypF